MTDEERIARHMVSAYRSLQVQEHDMSWRQMATLAHVVLHPEVSVREISAVLSVPKPSITRAIDALEAAGFVRRRRSRTDRRLVKVQAAPAGREFLARVGGALSHI